MTYTDETKRILEAVISGDCCPDCNAPNGDRHFDECPQHPENQACTECSKGIGHMLTCSQHPENVPVLRPKVERDRMLAELRRDESASELIARAKALMAAPGCTECDDPQCGWAIYEMFDKLAALIPELIAALERRPLVPIVDDLASERLDAMRDERDELLVRVDELAEEIAELRRQLPDYEVTR